MSLDTDITESGSISNLTELTEADEDSDIPSTPVTPALSDRDLNGRLQQEANIQKAGT